MKKNAFTLIELLATIVILSLLVLFTITAVSSQYKNKKDSLYDNQLQTIKLAAEMWGSENKSKLEKYNNEACVSITLGYLKNEGYIDNNIKNPKTGELLKDDDIFVNITPKSQGYTYEVIDTISKKCDSVITDNTFVN